MNQALYRCWRWRGDRERGHREVPCGRWTRQVKAGSDKMHARELGWGYAGCWEGTLLIRIIANIYTILNAICVADVILRALRISTNKILKAGPVIFA